MLLQLKKGFNFNTSLSQKLARWDSSIDCCRWPGIRCDPGGHVIGLDLSGEMIMGGLDDAMAMFNLQHLQVLDLSFNNFNTTVPTGIGNLTYLRYLNLSSAGFYGQIPAAISGLTKLVGLDLSMLYFPGAPTMKLENPNLLELVKNLAQLVDLRLDGVNISAQGNQWCQALASSVKNLEALSMSNCFLSGRIDSSLSKLQSLSVIRLDSNEFSSPIPDFFAEFRNLTVLRLSSCLLNGEFPETIFQVPSLELLDLSNNGLLHGVLPDFPQNHSMQTLLLSGTNFSGMLPASMGNLGKLSRIELEGCNFNGPVPKSMEDLTQLVYVDLASNHFTGPIPSLGLSKNLVHLDLSYNQLAGSIPRSIFELRSLKEILLSSNRFNGSVQLNWIRSLQNLTTLDLSYNNLTIDASGNSSTSSSFPQFGTLKLASSNLRMFPKLGNQTWLANLDLSDNNIEGILPRWILESTTLSHLNLSHNHLTGLEVPISLPRLIVLDMHDNQLQGDIPIIPSSSFMAFQESCSLETLDLSKNQLEGSFPKSLSNCTSLKVLDLGNNRLSDGFPCLLESKANLRVLILRNNNFHGGLGCPHIPEFSALYVLNFSNNAFTGQIPTVLGNLSQLESLDLSNNELSGQIPQELARLTFLSALNLSNNHLAGSIPTGSQLQTFDNSSFGGNPGLCGIPLSRYCIPQRIQWTLLSIEFGGVFGLAAVILPAMLWPRFQNWYWPRIDSLIVRLFPRLYVKDRNRHLRQRRRRGRRSSR
ncbi:Receptor-like protein 50 [Linum perenne]